MIRVQRLAIHRLALQRGPEGGRGHFHRETLGRREIADAAVVRPRGLVVFHRVDARCQRAGEAEAIGVAGSDALRLSQTHSRPGSIFEDEFVTIDARMIQHAARCRQESYLEVALPVDRLAADHAARARIHHAGRRTLRSELLAEGEVQAACARGVSRVFPSPGAEVHRDQANIESVR